MSFLGDREASKVEARREVVATSRYDLATTKAHIIAAVRPTKAPIVGSKVSVQEVNGGLRFLFGNKLNSFWVTGVILTDNGAGGTSVRAACVQHNKGREVANYLHETLKPVLDSIERGANHP